MGITLLINPGSSSKKYSLFQDGQELVNMRFEVDEQKVEYCIQKNGEDKKCSAVTLEQYLASVRLVLDTFLREKIIENLQEITSVGVRIVAPGTFFQSHRVIDDLFMHKLREREPAAPLHIPHTLRELELLRIELPEARVIGVSDSAFHDTMPTHARNYSIPRRDTETYDVHRFGYHGISNTSIIRRVPTVFGEQPARMIVCHVGSGVSMTAIKNNESIDTTMGFSPVSGLVMGSRAGDIEAGALLELMRAKNLSLYNTQLYTQNQGGLKGITDEADFRHILERLAQGDERAIEAMNLFTYHMQKTLGALSITLGGLDAVVLTATAVERSTTLRSLMLRNLEWFGITLDTERNDTLVSHDGIITAEESMVKVAVIRTNEVDEMLKVVNNFSS
jgi:acetate kinase